MGANFIVVSTPLLHLGTGVVKVHEPVRVQALGPELAVEGLDEGIVGGLAGPAEVQDDALLIGPQIKVPRDELGALIHPDRLGVADLATHPFQWENHVLATVAERGSTAGEKPPGSRRQQRWCYLRRLAI